MTARRPSGRTATSIGLRWDSARASSAEFALRLIANRIICQQSRLPTKLTSITWHGSSRDLSVRQLLAAFLRIWMKPAHAETLQRRCPVHSIPASGSRLNETDRPTPSLGRRSTLDRTRPGVRRIVELSIDAKANIRFIHRPVAGQVLERKLLFGVHVNIHRFYCGPHKFCGPSSIRWHCGSSGKCRFSRAYAVRHGRLLVDLMDSLGM